MQNLSDLTKKFSMIVMGENKVIDQNVSSSSRWKLQIFWDCRAPMLVLKDLLTENNDSTSQVLIHFTNVCITLTQMSAICREMA